MTGKSLTDEATIKLAIRLLRAGRATMGEVATLAGTSRQLVQHWARREGVNPVAARKAYLARMWRL